MIDSLLSFLAIGSAVSSANSVVGKVSSLEDVQQSIAADNRERCAFFRHFKYDLSDKIGSVSDIYEVR